MRQEGSSSSRSRPALPVVGVQAWSDLGAGKPPHEALPGPPVMPGSHPSTLPCTPGPSGRCPVLTAAPSRRGTLPPPPGLLLSAQPGPSARESASPSSKAILPTCPASWKPLDPAPGCGASSEPLGPNFASSTVLIRLPLETVSCSMAATGTWLFSLFVERMNEQMNERQTQSG